MHVNSSSVAPMNAVQRAFVSITIEPERSLAADESDAYLELKAGVDAVSHSSLPWSEPDSKTHTLGDALLRLKSFLCWVIEE
ncbi:hypothetical protein PCASD_01881 [Puccinia coronata f. sp. avenae]|uniref:Uncharacterized protein n=1 Tax=Puccinia coronata f. sp. avenae TaxID=200324 RepID=A0A2N5VJM6_9BASI|nr:hypothetical protein PCASD_01881 [Puccinia coronata f. sp. avenae]